MHKIYIILLIILNSCNNSNKKNLVIEKTKNDNTELIFNDVKKILIEGNWNLNSHKYSDKILIFDKNHSPEYGHTFKFNDSGNIIIKKISKYQRCGNGNEIISSGSWSLNDKIKRDDLINLKTIFKGYESLIDNDLSLTLNIKGQSFLVSEYEYKRIYTIEKISKNRIRLVKKESILEYYKKHGYQ